MCKLEKDFSAFTPRTQGRLKRLSACRKCTAARATLRRNAFENREEVYNRRHSASRLNGKSFTYKDYLRLKTEQKNVCPLCLTTCKDTAKNRLVADHDHVTGKIRGLICNRCNYTIGWIEQDPEKIRKMFKYLETGGVL